MDHIENEYPKTPALFVNAETKSYLLETAKWGKFLAIMGYISIGIMVVLGFVMLTQLSNFQTMNPAYGMMPFFYFIIAIIYFFPVRFLYNFSEDIRTGASLDDILILESGFKNLKSLFKFMGITTIVMLSLYVLIIIGVIAFFTMIN